MTTTRRLSLTLALMALLVCSCTQDHNARKQKYLLSGERYFAKSQYREAAIQFSNAIMLDPSFADAHSRLGQAYLKLHQSERAEQEYEDVVRLRPDDYQARMIVANLLIGHRKFGPAEKHTEVLCQQRPNDPAVHSLEAALLAAEGRLPQAIGEAQKAIALSSGRWEPYLTLALLQMRSGNSNAAELSFKRVIELAPGSVQARMMLGNLYESQRRPVEAEQQFINAIGISAQNREPREALARLLIAEGKPAAAEQVLLQARRELPNDPQTSLDLSNFYFHTGALNKAASEFDALHRRRPEDIQITKKYIQLLIQLKDYERAQRLDDGLLRVSPNDSDALLYRGQIQINEGRNGDAIQTLEGLVHGAPDNGEAHFALGVAYDKEGNLERADAEWQAALRINPNALDATQAVAHAAMAKGDMRRLQAAATQMISLQPQAAEGYSLRALSDINLKQVGNAEDDINKAIEVAPQSGFGYVELGNLRFAQKRYVEAQRAYEHALTRDINSADALRGLVNSLLMQKQVDKAIASIKVRLSKASPNSGSYDLLGNLLFIAAKDFAGAEAAFERSTQLNPHDLDAWVHLCQVRAAKQELAFAISTDEQAIRANPGRPGLYILLGDLYRADSEWSHAEKAYQNALAINGQDPIASNDLARTMIHTGESLDAALSLAQRARAGMPDSPAVFDTMGWIYYKQGRNSLALKSLEEALHLSEAQKIFSSSDIHYHLGMIYIGLKQPALARKHLEQALQLTPAYPHAREIKQELADLRR